MYLFQVYYSLLVPAFELYHHCYQPDPFIDIFYYFMSSSCEQYKKDSKSCSLRFLIWCSLLNVGTNIYYLCNLSRLRLSISNLSERNLFASAQTYIRLWRDEEMIQTVREAGMGMRLIKTDQVSVNRCLVRQAILRPPRH